MRVGAAMHSYPYYRTNQSNGIITVSGEHTLYVDPDQAIVSIGIVTNDKELEVAQNENKQLSNRVVQSLLNNGVRRQDIQTSTYQVLPQYQFEDGKQTFTGYEVRQVFRVTVKSIEKVGKIIDDALKSGANRVENIQFIQSNPIESYQQALALAYQEAYQKALTLSGQSNQQLNPQPKSITEQSRPSAVPFMNTAYLKAADESTAVQPGQIAVTAIITVEFRTH
ncbi:SIMPL domain-containing protein [Rossellomorea vietnamensis]|uniref:SIMPL domain-containing protein n=1 Tax=Rossellomorea vietnamensis TaxID=218284 RepID=A0ACD4CCD4_9BACI|nr:SIMPL domain-containing protein [Rossellomorea vietnamensis]UXH45941.1 SIMPL domain-containing protein [Rossellomorea vietnamensis]